MTRRILTNTFVIMVTVAGLLAAATPARAQTESEATCYEAYHGFLICEHVHGVYLWEHRSYGSHVVSQINRTLSTFYCWGYGDQHSGGNNVWYWTLGDDGDWGNVPAVDVYTPVDPFPGVVQC